MRLEFSALLGVLIAVLAPAALAQSTDSLQFADVGLLAEIPAVAGYEQELSGGIREQLKALEPKTDNLGNVYVTVGSGAPHRLVVIAIDEPGYVVSGITPDGFLRVQRLPQAPPNSVFDLLHAAQPVWVITRDGKKVPGVFAGLSVHLQGLRLNSPKMSDLDQMYVDIGATSG
jgi:putative aminopeptidase FrvX